MKKSFVLTSVCCLVFSTAVLSLPAAETKGPKAAHACCAACVPAVTSLSDKSIYQLGDSWTNDAGLSFRLASLAGRPVLVAMFFANCQYACPLLVYQMQQVEQALPETLRTNVSFVLVSFDTERDDVAALHNYRAQHGLDPARWILLRGSPDAVLELAAVLGVQFKKDARGQFLHSNLITLLNPQGEIAYQKTGLNLEMQPMVQLVEGLAAK